MQPPYWKDIPQRRNEFGIPQKDIYRNEDLATILNVSPATIQWRCNKGKYGRIDKDTAGRRYFTIEDLRRIVSQERTVNELGLPIRAHYTAADLARLLDVPYDRVRYLLDTGRLLNKRTKANDSSR